MLKNLSDFKAAIFDMDGVLTQTATLHARAWKEMFDDYLKKKEGTNFIPFDIDKDYPKYIDGKSRYDGVRSFLESRNISLLEGNAEDAPGKETVCGLGNRKNQLFQELLKTDGVHVYKDAISIVKEWKEKGMKVAVISASKNAKKVLEAVAIKDLFDVTIDGVTSEAEGINGKPAPDVFLEAAERLHVKPEFCLVIEDSLAGVKAGKAGNFGLVVGVARKGDEEELQHVGADILVNKLVEIERNFENLVQAKDPNSLPHAIKKLEEIRERLENKKVALFLDYDGTLSPIVKDPDKATLSAEMKNTLKQLSSEVPVTVISGRDRKDVQGKVGLDNIYYAGSHGFDITGPNNTSMQYEGGERALPMLDKAEENLKNKLKHIEGCRVERKKYAIAIHYRNVADEDVRKLKQLVFEELNRHEELKKGGGKKIIELKPNIDWHKGKATRWLLDALNLDKQGVVPVFIGDDITDEDAIREVKRDGIGIIVGDHGERTYASYRLESVEEVKEFLSTLYETINHTANEGI